MNFSSVILNPVRFPETTTGATVAGPLEPNAIAFMSSLFYFISIKHSPNLLLKQDQNLGN